MLTICEKFKDKRGFGSGELKSSKVKQKNKNNICVHISVTFVQGRNLCKDPNIIFLDLTRFTNGLFDISRFLNL